MTDRDNKIFSLWSQLNALEHHLCSWSAWVMNLPLMAAEEKSPSSSSQAIPNDDLLPIFEGAVAEVDLEEIPTSGSMIQLANTVGCCKALNSQIPRQGDAHPFIPPREGVCHEALFRPSEGHIPVPHLRGPDRPVLPTARCMKWQQTRGWTPAGQPMASCVTASWMITLFSELPTS